MKGYMDDAYGLLKLFSMAAKALRPVLRDMVNRLKALSCEVVTTVNAVQPVRLDLKLGHMPEQPMPKHRLTRQTRDQRPLIQQFRLPRNDFSY